jgi:hypothetical protein
MGAHTGPINHEFLGLFSHSSFRFGLPRHDVVHSLSERPIPLGEGGLRLGGILLGLCVAAHQVDDR